MAEAVMAGAAVVSALATGYSTYRQDKAADKRAEMMEEQQKLAKQRMKMRREKLENQEEQLEQMSEGLDSEKDVKEALKQGPSKARDRARVKIANKKKGRGGTLLTDVTEEEEAPIQKKSLLGG